MSEAVQMRVCGKWMHQLWVKQPLRACRGCLRSKVQSIFAHPLLPQSFISTGCPEKGTKNHSHWRSSRNLVLHGPNSVDNVFFMIAADEWDGISEVTADSSVALDIFSTDCGTRHPQTVVYDWVCEMISKPYVTISYFPLLNAWLRKSAVAQRIYRHVNNGKVVIYKFWSNGAVVSSTMGEWKSCFNWTLDSERSHDSGRSSHWSLQSEYS